MYYFNFKLALSCARGGSATCQVTSFRRISIKPYDADGVVDGGEDSCSVGCISSWWLRRHVVVAASHRGTGCMPGGLLTPLSHETSAFLHCNPKYKSANASPSLLLIFVTERQCELRDDTPTVARTTTRSSMIRQRFSRRVRRYPVSFGRRTLRQSAHPPRAPTTNPDNTRANRRSRSPATRHSYNPSTLLHAPVHRSGPSARGDLRARPADDSAALGTLQHPRLPDVDEAWPEAWAS